MLMVESPQETVKINSREGREGQKRVTIIINAAYLRLFIIIDLKYSSIENITYSIHIQALTGYH